MASAAAVHPTFRPKDQIYQVGCLDYFIIISRIK